MNSPLVSAIITTHNRKDLLVRAIDSVLNQTYQNLELIVVDDASSVDLSDLCSKYPRVKFIFITKEDSRGGNYARNLGIKSSSGKYCAFLDDDDYWESSKIEKQVSLIESKRCGLVFCGKSLEFVDDDSVVFKDRLPQPSLCGDLKKTIMYTIVTTTSCMLISREMLFDVGLFDEDLKFWQEYELSIRLAQLTPFYFVNECLTFYRVDVKDKGRLTNKYYSWKEAVEYIHKKHTVLYSELSFMHRLRSTILIWNDALPRCKSAGLRVKAFGYSILLFPIKCLLALKKVIHL